MNRRKNLAASMLLVVLLVAMLVPVARLLSLGWNDAFDAKQEATRIALEEYAEHENRAAARAVLPMMDIEEIWALEDAREQSEAPLVSAMYCGKDELGYDREDQTFYCTLGMETGDSWPEIALSARGVEDVQVVWMDDYSYDWCSDAIAEGYRYELFAYTQTEYAYIGVVFTGLPIVTLHAGEGVEIGDEYAPGRIAISAAGYEAADSAALMHWRGGGVPKFYPKYSYRVEFCAISDQGEAEKNDVSVLGMPADSDWLLIANDSDETRIRNYVAWQLWNAWNTDEQGFGLLESRLVEVFVDDTYMGLYQLMQRMDVDREIEQAGGDPNVDIGMRIIAGKNIETRPHIELKEQNSYVVELRHKPGSMSVEEAFDAFSVYHKLNAKKNSMGFESDEEFAQAAQSSFDMRSLMTYFTYAQAMGFGYDNVYNNVHLWTRMEDGRYVFHLSPWDMDRAFETLYTDGTDDINMWMYAPVRVLNLDVGGSREQLWDIWNEKCGTIFTDDAIYQAFTQAEELVNASGAYRRDIGKWLGEDRTLNMAEYIDFVISHRNLAERQFSYLWPAENMDVER